MNNPGENSLFSKHPAVEKLLKRVVLGIEDYARSHMAELPASTLDGLVELVVDEVRGFTEGQVSHIYELVKIGLGLSSEKRIDRLLEMIVSEARRFTNADGGTLYIKSDDERLLEFAIIQNDSLSVFMGGSGETITWKPVLLHLANGRENHKNVSAYCALHGKAINIPDVYSAQGFDFQGTKDFDASTGYRSRSMLVIPMRDHEDDVIGVLQLLNAQDRATGAVIPFPADEVDMVTSLASEAAIALTNMRLVKGLENLLDAFVRTIGDAIDEKSPYTAGHIFRVANLTEMIALEVDRCDSGRFGPVTYSDEEFAEIRMAAWLHDVGKITTPEFLMDKSTKLETIFDRIELIRHRMAILKRDEKILSMCCGEMLPKKEVSQKVQGKLLELQEAVNFLDTVNLGSESLSEESIARIHEIAKMTYEIGGMAMPFLADDEVENLCVRKGTLNDRERSLMNNHVDMTIRMLERLPFPKKLRNVPIYAGMHHEKLNGSGYPRALKGDDIPLPARMLALADILEALTAADRPYKRGKMLSETMEILAGMAGRGELDADLCDLIVDSGLILKYACTVLPVRQRDDFFWRGKPYSVRCSDTR